MKNKINRKNYALLIIGALFVIALFGSGTLYSTYSLDDDSWSLKIGIESITIDDALIWSVTNNDAIMLGGSATDGFDLVIVSPDGVEAPISVIENAQVLARDTGKPSVGVSIESVQVSTNEVLSDSPAEKKYEYTIMGYLVIRTYAVSDDSVTYTLEYATGEYTSVSKIAELNSIDISVDISYSLIAGENVAGTCEFTTLPTGNAVYQMVDNMGSVFLPSEFAYTDSQQKMPVDSLVMVGSGSGQVVDAVISGEMAPGFEVFDGELNIYDSYLKLPISLKAEQVVSELENARFSVNTELDWLPLNSESIFGDQAILGQFIMVVVIAVVIFAIFGGLAIFSFGSPVKELRARWRAQS